jgi:transposase
MSKALNIPVKESLKELKILHKKASALQKPRLFMLIKMKENSKQGITKQQLMELVDASSQSIQTWRTNYKNGGLSLLLSHKKGGYKKSSFNQKERIELEKLMHNPQNNINGYKELQSWVKKEFKKEIKYNTLLKFMVNTFKTKVKVARKSHIKKDEELVSIFKKTSVPSAKKQ